MLYLQKAKSLIEKKRRARINACLEELKAIVTEHNAYVSVLDLFLNNVIFMTIWLSDWVLSLRIYVFSRLPIV